MTPLYVNSKKVTESKNFAPSVFENSAIILSTVGMKLKIALFWLLCHALWFDGGQIAMLFIAK